jgi:hypothetical protein
MSGVLAALIPIIDAHVYYHGHFVPPHSTTPMQILPSKMGISLSFQVG